MPEEQTKKETLEDYIPETGQDQEELSAETELALRKEIQSEVFEGKTVEPETEPKIKSTDDKTGEHSANADSDNKSIDDDAKDKSTDKTSQADDPKKEDLKPEEDQLTKISQALNLLTATVNGFEKRIKTNEQRVGSLNNRMHEAKIAAKTTANAPTEQQIDSASETDDGWKDLQTNFPSWAKAFERRIADSMKDVVSKSELADIRKAVKNSVSDGSLEKRLIGIVHPDWQQAIKTLEYSEWLKNQEADIITKAYHGTTAEEAIDVLNHFKAHQQAQEVPETDDESTIETKVQDRLEGSVVVNKQTKTKPTKTEAEMTEDEYRRKIAREIFT